MAPALSRVSSVSLVAFVLCAAGCNKAETSGLAHLANGSQMADAGAKPRMDDAASSAPLPDAEPSVLPVDAETAAPQRDATTVSPSNAPAEDAGTMSQNGEPTAMQFDAGTMSQNGDPVAMQLDAGMMPQNGDPAGTQHGADTMPQNPDAGSTPADAGAMPAPDQPTATSVKQLALGRAHGCSLDPAISGLLCWGDNSHGQATVPSLTAPRFVAAGGDVTCAIHDAGVKCWGDAQHGQLRVPAMLGQITQLAVGDAHVCALTAAGALRCWGDDTYGQLSAPAASGVRAIGAGMRHSCALAANGVKCWGDNALGQLDVPTLVNPVQLAVGGFHSCVIDGESVVCWGGDAAALLHEIPSASEPKLIAAGRHHSCVLDATGVRCWGDASAGDLTPRELTNVQQLAVGGTEHAAHACARHQQGVACWGDNSLGQTAYDGSPLHMLYRAESNIAAPPAVVWGVLMDLDNYGLWNPYTIAMKSSLHIGDAMVMTVKMNDLVTLEQTEYIRVLDGRKACWGIDTTSPEQNSGERCQWLEPLPDGSTHYVTEDLIEGTLNPLVIALFGDDTRNGFNGVASALKTRAEALYQAH
jgi:hypothetical protein